MRTLSGEIDPKASRPSLEVSDEAVVSSKKVLRDFRKVAARDVESEKARHERLERYKAECKEPHDVYHRLKNWADNNVKREKSWLPSFGLPSKAPIPKPEELLAVARHYYPPRVDIHNCNSSLSSS